MNPNKEANQLWDEFLSRWPIEKLRTMSLDEYSRGGDKDCFTYWIEHRTNSLGGVGGGSSFKFGIYNRADSSEKRNHRGLKYDGNYAWYEKYGTSKEMAFENIRKLIVRIAEAAKAEDWKTIDKVDLGSAYKWKMAFLYQNKDKPKIIPTYNPKVLCAYLGVPIESENLSDIYLQIHKQNQDTSVITLGKEVWGKGKSLVSEKDAEEETDELENNFGSEYMKNTETPLNQILYGPPGTGKTYSTINKTLEIIDPDYLDENRDDRTALKKRFDELKVQGHVSFITFHQSFSYEDFVEGLRATTNEETKNIEYVVEEGVFKKICNAAASKVTVGSHKTISPDNRSIWKMSLGNTLGDEDDIYEECINKGYVLLGYGRNINFTGCTSKKDIVELFTNAKIETKTGSNRVTFVHTFVNLVKPDDLVIISDGNHKFRAIGRVKSDYYLLDDENRDGYLQCRDVEWLRVYSPSRPREELFRKNLIQKSIYELRPHNIKLDVLGKLLESTETEQGSQPYVLIIDEINRGNISRIFGELITLLEPDKRSGAPEALEVTLPYSKEPFSVPDNLYIIGTMNTADRSLALMDTALRRRFHFEEMMPDTSLLDSIDVEGIDIRRMLDVMNQRIEVLYDREHTLGHSFFLPLRDKPNIELLANIFDRQIIPLLEEYFFEDWDKIRLVLGDNKKSRDIEFITKKYSEKVMTELLGDEYNNHTQHSVYQRNLNALYDPNAYITIYQ